jgi:MFS transporter, ACS family, hexuronate transporter
LPKPMPDVSPQDMKLQRPEAYAWIILTLLLVAQLVMSMGAYAYGPLAPFLKDAFLLSRMEIGALVSIFYLSSAVVAIPAGLLVDRLTAHLMLVVCLVVEGLPYCGLSWSTGFWTLVIFSALSGIGYGMINQVSIKGVMAWFPMQYRATVMGVKQCGVTLAGALGALFLPYLALKYGWKSGPVLIGMSMLATALLCFVLYRERPLQASSGEPVRSENKPNPSLKETLNPNLLSVTLMTPFLAFNQGAVSTFLVLYLKENLQFSVTVAGYCLTVAMAAGTVGRIGWGMISDRCFHGDRLKPIVILSMLSALGALGMAFLPSGASLGLPVFWSLICGVTMIGWNALLIVLVAEVVEKGREASAVGVVLSTNSFGFLVGPFVFGYVADHWGYFSGWIMLVGSSVISALGFMRVARKLRENRKAVS